jgi:3-methyladenine DNA glycosylase Tag
VQYQLLWDHAMDHLCQAEGETLLARWRSEIPATFTDQDLLRDYAWVVFSCGLTPQVTQRYWERLGSAFRSWDPQAATDDSRSVRIEALGVIRNPRKIDAVLGFAEETVRNPGAMQRLTDQPLKEVLSQLQTHPFIGATNRYQLARNLGWDVVTQTGPVARMAQFLQTTPEGLCGTIAQSVGERMRTVDLVLWYWAHQVGDQQMREIASLCRLM